MLPLLFWLILHAIINKDKTLKASQRVEVIKYIQSRVAKNSSVSDANFIAFKNGIYDIINDTLTPFSPDIIITNKIDYNYNPEAYSELADNTLNKLAVNDKSIRMLLEEVIGYCFYRRSELRKSFILTGEKSNGKSTYLDMIKNLLGDENTAALDLKELGDRFKTAELFGKLANICDDIGDEFIGNASIFRKLASGDRLNVEKKGQNPFDFNNYAKLLFSANDIPRIKDKSGAVLDRLIIVPFDARFSRDDPDFNPYIKYELRKDDVMEYLIVLGIDGLKRVLKANGFTSSKRVENEIKEYNENNNPILLFFTELDVDIDIVNQPTRDVYLRYSEFCLSNNYQPLSNVEFSKQVKKNYKNLDTARRRVNGKLTVIFIKENL